MIIEREAMVDLLFMSYNKGFTDAAFILTELSVKDTNEKEVKDKLREILPQ